MKCIFSFQFDLDNLRTVDSSSVKLNVQITHECNYIVAVSYREQLQT